MKIAMIGAGNVGSALGTQWAKQGHQVAFGVPDPGKDKTQAVLAEAGPNARATTPAEAAADAEIVFLTVPWSKVGEAVPALGDLTGKILVDCTNPVAPGPSLAVGHTTSGGEEVAKLAPGARVVKGFHTVGAELMRQPRFGDRAAANFLCGDDAEAKRVAAELSKAIGWEPIDAGPLAQARLTEPLAMLWITLAMKYGMGRGFAFGVLQREPAKA
jgi:hypothetical protein